MITREMLTEEIPAEELPYWGELVRDGFVFIQHELKIFDVLLIPVGDEAWSNTWKKTTRSLRSLKEHIQLINDLQLKKAYITGDSVGFLSECPSLKGLSVNPLNSQSDTFDFSPLYNHPEIKILACSTIDRGDVRNVRQLNTTVDYSKINGLLCLVVDLEEKGHLNFNQIDTLKELHVYHFKDKSRDLSNLFCSDQLEILVMLSSNIKTLNGIERTSVLEEMGLFNCRSLEDISALTSQKDTLKKLVIEGCSKIKDLSFLNKFTKLETLIISGKHSLKSLSFIEKMPNLKKIILNNIDVEDGNMLPLANIHHFSIRPIKKYFKESYLKAKQLRKEKYRDDKF